MLRGFTLLGSCLKLVVHEVQQPLLVPKKRPSAPPIVIPLCSRSYHHHHHHRNPSNTWSRLTTLFGDNVAVLGRLLARQCEFVAAYRFRRANVLQHLRKKRSRSGGSSSGGGVAMMALGRRVCRQKRPLGLLVGAVLFNWEDEQITDDEMEMCACDFLEVERILGKRGSNLKAFSCSGPKENMSSWELIISKDHLKVWRKPVKNSSLYEYKVFGTFFDIPARAFFRVQVDTEYRKKWDSLVIRLDVIDRLRNLKKKSISEVVHWVMHYPYPMYSRDYVYVRRYMIDPEKNLMLMLSRSTGHPAAPVDKDYVRVTAYRSQMVIRPHSNFDENGMDYVLTYFDDPQAIFPTPAYNWMASSGVPDFVNKLHQAAKNSLHEEVPTIPKPVTDDTGSFRRSKWKTLQQMFA